jgi:hypothetical protein
VKQSADERIPEDVRGESSSSDSKTKGKGMLGKFREIKVIRERATPSAETLLTLLHRTVSPTGYPRSTKIALAMNTIASRPSFQTSTSPRSAVTNSSIAERRSSSSARNTTIIRLA